MHDEAENLALLHVVKTHDANVAVGILRPASLHFAQHFLSRVGVEQGQFPHRPIVNLRVRGFVELNGRNVAHFQNIGNLPLDLGIGEGGQVR